MEDPIGTEIRIIHRLDIMEIVAIVAGGGILIACRYRLSVDGLPVYRLMVMALDALGNDDTFILFPALV
jgi:hypothetical protein